MLIVADIEFSKYGHGMGRIWVRYGKLKIGKKIAPAKSQRHKKRGEVLVSSPSVSSICISNQKSVSSRLFSMRIIF